MTDPTIDGDFLFHTCKDYCQVFLQSLFSVESSVNDITDSPLEHSEHHPTSYELLIHTYMMQSDLALRHESSPACLYADEMARAMNGQSLILKNIARHHHN
jgi:hypothetical protein